MERYKETLQALSEQTKRCSTIDGFQSEELRNLILHNVQKIILHPKPQGVPSRFLPMNATEQIRSEYFREAQNTGWEIAGKYAANLIREDTPDYLRELILAGAETIGSRIGRGYAAEIYPELRRLQIAGIAPKTISEKTPVPRMNFFFTITDYGNCLEFSEVAPTREKPGSEIVYDEINDRHVETFVFPNVDDADDALAAWERHNHDQHFLPPVQYMLTVEKETPDSAPEISSIVHVPRGEKSDFLRLENGTVVERFVMPTLAEAEKKHREFLTLRNNALKNASANRPKGKKIPQSPKEHAKERTISPPERQEPARRDKKKQLSISK